MEMRFQKDCVIGGPISCVSLPQVDLCVYGHGPFLHRASLRDNNRGDDVQNGNNDDKLLMFPQGGTVHGIRYFSTPVENRPLAAVFGGRQLGFVENVLPANDSNTLEGMQINPLLVIRGKTIQKETTEILSLPDWIWDCRCIPKDGFVQMFVGLAHNVVESWILSVFDSEHNNSPVRMKAMKMQTFRGTVRCISYCMAINLKGTQTAVGTVFNEILIWNIPSQEQSKQSSMTQSEKEESTEQPPTVVVVKEACRLKGHLGVIHALQFHESGRLLASTSDDRSVRVWESSGENDNQKWVLKWTGWGHTARGWDVAFTSVAWNPRNVENKPNDRRSILLSSGEDGTLRVWDYAGLFASKATDGSTPSLLATLRGHSCQCIWRTDTCRNMAVTSGNDGTVAFYDVERRIVNYLEKSEDEPTSYFGSPYTWQRSFSLPDDRPANSQSPVTESEEHKCKTTTSTPKKKKSKKQHKSNQQVVVGMNFFADRGGDVHVIVATREGSLMNLDIRNNRWEINSWCNKTSFVKIKDDSKSLNPADGCCMTLHPSDSKGMAVIGTVKGNLILAPFSFIDKQKMRFLLSAQEHRAVQRLAWVNGNTLLSFHVKSVLWWQFPSIDNLHCLGVEGDKCQIHHIPIKPFILSSETKGMGISYAYHEASKRLVIGDTRGSISLFALDNVVDDMSTSSISPCSVLKKAHGKEHVTALAFKDANRVLSVGNDGSILESIINSCGVLETLVSVPVGSCTGLTNIWLFPQSQSCSHAVVSGYYGNRFAILDAATGYEFSNIDTGGRQRAIDIFKPFQSGGIFPSNFGLALCVSQKGGRNDILIHMNSASNLNNVSASHSYHSIPTIGVPLHGETIFDLCLFPIDSSNERIALLTGSEDCIAKISLLEGKGIRATKALPPQVSSIRAVCSCSTSSGSTIVAIGGKLQVEFYSVSATNAGSADFVDIKHIGTGRCPDKGSIDHRINAVKAAQLSSGNLEKKCLIASVDSSGSCYVYQIPNDSSTRTVVDGILVFRTERPILSLDIVTSDNCHVLLLGTTSGEIAAFSLPLSFESNAWSELPMEPTIVWKAHAMGANSISARLTSKEKMKSVIRICSCGDDQGIHLCELIVTIRDEGLVSAARCLRNQSLENAGLSALKGIRLLDDEIFVATGYDQILSLWRWKEDEVHRLSIIPIDCGDVNCLATCVGKGERHFVSVGGAGVDVVTLLI